MAHHCKSVLVVALLAGALSVGIGAQAASPGLAMTPLHLASALLPQSSDGATPLGRDLRATTPLSGTTWTQQAELTSTAQTPNDGYGEAIAVSGNTAAVGAPGTPNETNYGAVYIFTRTASGVWTQQAELRDPQYGSGQNHFFGAAVALQGNTLVVGAWGATGAVTDSGAAYVYQRSGAAWTLRATLAASDGAYIDGFGFSVALSGATILVGVDGKNSGEGAAYVFAESAGIWRQQAELLYPGHFLYAEFGWAVAMWGNSAVVGAPRAQAAFAYARTGTTWRLSAVLYAPHSGLFFGNAVALWGSTALVSVYDGGGSVPGAAAVFTQSGRTWTLRAALRPPAGTHDGSFASALALSDQTAVVGGTAVFVYTGSGAQWALQAELTPTDRPPTDLGAAVAVQGATAVAGATGAPPAGYVFVRSGADWLSASAAADTADAHGPASAARWMGAAPVSPAARWRR